MPKLILSVFTEFDPANPKFLLPLGQPNPRLVGGSASERNCIFRVVVANLDAEPFSGDVDVVASIGEKAAVSWKVPSVTIAAGGATVFQGLGPGVKGGLCVLDTVGLPDGPVDLYAALKVADKIECECTMPLRINSTDLYANGPERPGGATVPVGTNDAAKKELSDKEKALSGNVAIITAKQEENKVLTPRIEKLKALLQ